MKLDKTGYNLICEFEGFRESPYKCSSGIPTIGYGSTFYSNGNKVTMNDKPVTKEQAFSLFTTFSDKYTKLVLNLLINPATQNQLNALVSFAYNIGIGNFQRSTLLKKVNKNPNDPSIKKEFLRWNKSSGKVLSGLVDRRKKESELYFK